MAQQSRKNPYGNLFKPGDLNTVARAQQDNSEPRVACGATRVPVNPDRDPKIATDRSITHYTMRVIPPHCR